MPQPPSGEKPPARNAMDHVQGNAIAVITITEYMDFDNAYVRLLHRGMQSLVDKNAGNVNVIYRHFPLDTNRYSQEAAEAIKKTIKKDLAALKPIPRDKLIDERYDKTRSIGVFKEP